MTPSNERIAPDERRWIVGLLVALLGLRVLAVWKISFTSDESQHLHVVWAWANHLWPYSAEVGDRTLPYRDVFDNHTPLFHLLCAPLFRLFGETAQVMISMRLAMIPLFAASLWLTGKIGAALFSPRAGWWAAVFAGWLPFLFLKTVEFRTDVLWMTAWLAVVAIAVGGPLTARRMFALGLAVGAAFAVSMKTVLLVLALLVAAVVVLVFWRRSGGRWRTRAALGGFGAALAGLLFVPGAIVAYFAAQHALSSADDPVRTLYYGVIRHNLLPHHAEHHAGIASRLFWFPVTLPLLVFAAARIFHATADHAQGLRRGLVLLMAGSFLALLHSYWPMITGQDYLPVAPLLIALATPGALALAGALRERRAGLPWLAVPLTLVALEIICTVKFAKRRPPRDRSIRQIADVLHFTDPGDYVMDAKDGAIFRRRPFYYALENVTKQRIHFGLIKDDIVERMIETRTCVASENEKRFGQRALDFMRANYLPAEGHYVIAGQRLDPEAGGRAAFTIQIAATYALVTPRGAASGKLDGQPYAGKIFLDAGPHEFVSDGPPAPLVLVWAQALQRGFQPDFSDKKRSTKPSTTAP